MNFVLNISKLFYSNVWYKIIFLYNFKKNGWYKLGYVWFSIFKLLLVLNVIVCIKYLLYFKVNFSCFILGIFGCIFKMDELDVMLLYDLVWWIVGGILVLDVKNRNNLKFVW